MASSLFSKLSFSPSNTSLIDDVESLSCPICLEVFSKPKRIPCGHVFCKDCLNNYEEVLEPACPICRQLFTVSSSKKATDIEKCISMSSILCRGCSNKIPLTKYRHHNSTCAGLEAMNKETIKLTSQQVNQDEACKTVNRQTFRCPFCGLQNLDTHGLVKHCNSEHPNHQGRVVCPICASMPWGNRHQKSSDFLRHLNLRHKFEYDFVVVKLPISNHYNIITSLQVAVKYSTKRKSVDKFSESLKKLLWNVNDLIISFLADFSMDDESMLERAIKASLEEQ